MERILHWVASAGGPLIVVAAEFAPQWRGTEGSSLGGSDPVSDYIRACDVAEYLGTLEVGQGDALIFGDEPMRTTFVAATDGGVFVRWQFAQDEASVLRAIENFRDFAWKSTPHRVRIGDGGIFVFDSAYPGDALPPRSRHEGVEDDWWMRIDLLPGSYEVDLVECQPDEATGLILHRLRWSGFA